ncbi:MAG: class I SAM-dependent DNA methyltransferase [Promethearchaeota archaeon]
MEPQGNVRQFEEFVNSIYNNIEAGNLQQLRLEISSIEKYEDNFLKNYSKRKKEGVYYTVDTISNFISKEVLLMLINKQINDEYNNSAKLREIEDIFKLDTKVQDIVIRSLFNATICDPSCGSGVFLLSSANIIFNLIKKLNSKLQPNEIKKKILKNLFGYDINKNVIDLSILKLVRWYLDDDDKDIKKITSQLKTNIRSVNSLINSKLEKYDIIIGNPPYGNILTKNEKEILKEEKIFHKDIYCSFLLKALNWSKGFIGFLVPKSFLLRQGYIQFREKFLSKANLLIIIDIGSKLFKDATNEVQILLYTNKGNNDNKDLKVYNYPHIEITEYPKQEVDSLKICLNNNCSLRSKTKKFYVYTYDELCPYCSSNTRELNRIRIKPNPLFFKVIHKIEENGDLNYLNPISFPKLIRGEEDRGLALVKNNLRSDPKGSCFFISARNDFSYYSIKKNKSFTLEEMDAKLLKGNNYEYYLSPKLLIKHNNIIPEVVYTEDNVCFTSSIYSLLHDDPRELKYLCAVFNSALIQFYCIYAINNQKNTTINLNQYMIRHLPIIKASEQTKTILTNRVDKLKSLFGDKTIKPYEKGKYLLKEIDNSIFTIYSITENEKEIIIPALTGRIKHFKNIYG